MVAASFWCSARCASSARCQPSGARGAGSLVAQQRRGQRLRDRRRRRTDRRCASTAEASAPCSPIPPSKPSTRLVAPSSEAIWCWSKVRAASPPSESSRAREQRGRSKEGTRDLRAPLPAAALREWLGWLNVLRYVPFRVIAATITAMLISFVLAPWFIRELQKKQIGQVVRERRPRDAHDQGAARRRWAARSSCSSLLVPDHALGDLAQRLRARHDRGHRRLRRHRLPRRLPQDQASKNSGGLAGALQAPRAVRSSPARCSRTSSSRRITLPADWLEHPRRTSRSRSSRSTSTRSRCRSALYIAVRGLRRRRHVERGEPHRRPRRPRHRPGDHQRGHVPHLGVPRRRHVRHRQRRAALRRRDATSTSRTIASVGELAVFCGAMVGAGIGFLWYNTYPAQVFMGDVGSLALGGGLGTLRRVHQERAALDHRSAASSSSRRSASSRRWSRSSSPASASS